MDIFRDDQDYFNFMKRLILTLGVESPTLQRASLQGLRIQPVDKDAFSVVCYCLMPNHFHLLLRQNKNLSISKLMTKLCSSYSKYFNKKYDHVGHLFQDQFKAVLIENDEYLTWLSAYIHQNPKVASMVDDPRQYKWSSYSDFAGLDNILVCNKEIILDKFVDLKEYVTYVEDAYEPIRRGKLIDRFDIILD